MATLLDLIKRAGAEAVEASSPVHLLYGEVVSASPLAVQVDQRFILPAEFLVVTEGLTPHTVPLSSTAGGTQPLVIRRGLESGDRVLLLRVQGGQQYVILDRVVSA